MLTKIVGRDDSDWIYGHSVCSLAKVRSRFIFVPVFLYCPPDCVSLTWTCDILEYAGSALYGLLVLAIGTRTRGRGTRA